MIQLKQSQESGDGGGYSEADMWAAYWEGYKDGRHIEQMQPVHRRTARSLFDRWLNRTYG